LANSLEGIGEFDAARSYLIADTNKTWGKNAALLNLLKHDIKYQSGERCITTYNEYRNLGFKMDPIGLYRLKIFFSASIPANYIKRYSEYFITVFNCWIVSAYSLDMDSSCLLYRTPLELC
jgi:hypothetical protein